MPAPAKSSCKLFFTRSKIFKSILLLNQDISKTAKAGRPYQSCSNCHAFSPVLPSSAIKAAINSSCAFPSPELNKTNGFVGLPKISSPLISTHLVVFFYFDSVKPAFASGKSWKNTTHPHSHPGLDQPSRRSDANPSLRVP